MLYFHGRMTEENTYRIQDLDNVPFIDVHEFTGKVPVLLVRLHHGAIHRVLPHAGIESTMKVLSKIFKAKGNVSARLKRFKANCTRCSIILKKTFEINMSSILLPG